MRPIETVLFLISSPLLAQSTSPTPPPGRGVIEQATMTTLPRGGEDVPASAFVGTWSLSDEQNDVFDVVLDADGSARSNWAKGTHGAEGEGGRWSLYGHGIRIDYDDGWIDMIRFGPVGFEQVSYSPETPLAGPWSNHGKAVRLEVPLAEWVGVYGLTNVTDGKPFAIALQSDGQSFKTINEDKRGLWSIRGEVAEIRWADGWHDEIRRSADGSLEQRSWKPGQPRSEPPIVTPGATRLRREALPGTDAMTNRSRASLQVDPSTFAGTWNLSDEHNHGFNVVLFPGGAARSTWSEGPHGSRGEGGRWRPYGNGVRIDYDSGWIDLLRFGARGFDELAFSPTTPIAGPASSLSLAARTSKELEPFVGVFELRAEATGKPFCIALQSDGLAFKNIPGEPPKGTWTIEDGVAVVSWSNGWVDEIHLEPDGRVSQRTWHPGLPRATNPPSATAGGRRLRDGIPGPLRPAAPTPPPG